MKRIQTLLIANRGEIACRIIRTCRRLGIRTVAVYSDADARAQHVRQADQAVHIGGSRPAESYLCIDKIIAAAKHTGADGVHPGYGFLSENADFAEACEQAGMLFVGPSAASMRKMGSKAGAKLLMQAHGVPVVPGYTGEDQDPALLQTEADRIGYPLMIKAAHGGGGKGMRIVRASHEFAAALESCQREARNAFGRDRVLLERYVVKPRHIEFQVFADQHGHTMHLNERECSAQRRYQKVLEESPSAFLNSDLRARMGAAAVQAAKAIDYCNAGTVEFIVGEQGDFYFMEINTRLQVEHPVTEMVLGLDLVAWQIRIAEGQPLPLQQHELQPNGHAIELRLYAEDPEQGFLPGSGKIERLRLPTPSDSVRVDGGVIEGDTVSIFYDPMITKLIVHGADRSDALRRMRLALAECDVVGPKSNIEFLERLVRHPAVINAEIDTGYLDRHLDEFLPKPEAALPELALWAVATAQLLEQEQVQRNSSADPHSPWGESDAWRLGHHGKRVLAFEWRGQRFEMAAHGHAGNYRLDFGSQHAIVRHARLGDTMQTLEIDGQAHRLQCHRSGTDWLLFVDERRFRIHDVPAFAFTGVAKGGSDKLLAPMPGRIIAVRAERGDTVTEGQELIVMEAMKMEITLRAARAGKLAELRASVGEFVEADALLVKIED